MTAISKSNALVWLKADLAVDTLVYAAGDLIGGKVTLAAATRSDGFGGLIQHVTLIDLAKQGADIDVAFFDADPTGTTFTDNAPFDPADADLANLVGVAQLTTHVAFNDNGLSQALNLAIPFALGATASAIYAALISRGTPTYAAAADLKLRVGILRD